MEPAKVQKVKIPLAVTLAVFAAVGRAGVPIPPDADLLPRLEKDLRGQRQTMIREVRRLGNRTLELELTAAIEADFEIVREVFSQVPSYPSWVLEGINDRPSGGKFFFQVLSLEADPKIPSVLHAKFLVDLPLLKHRSRRAFRFDIRSGPQSFTQAIEALPLEEGLIETAEGVLKIFPAARAPDLVWVYFRGMAVLRSWLLYEALPERILKKETGERLEILLANYRKVEQRRMEKVALSTANVATPSRNPREKTVGPGVPRMPQIPR